MSTESQGFINPNRLTICVKYFLFAQILIALLTIGSCYLEYQLLSDIKMEHFESQEQLQMDANASDLRQRILGIIYLVNFIASGIAILMWIYRANANARQLGAKNMEFTPGWSIGFYFIPILTIWKPYQAMKEIWQASEYPKNWKTIHVGPTLPIWWGLWLINSFLGQIIFKASVKSEGIDELLRTNVLTQISSVVDIALAAIFWVMVLHIHENQMKAYAASQVVEELELPEEEELGTLEIPLS